MAQLFDWQNLTIEMMCARSCNCFEPKEEQRGGFMTLVVLTLGRSGSSLAMQTLGLLGHAIVGKKFGQHNDLADAQLHHSLNPHGYYEDPEIYAGGPRTVGFRKFVDAMGKSACKMDLKHFVDAQNTDVWRQAEASIDCIIVSFREPAAQAQSEFLGSGLAQGNPSARDQWLFIAEFLNRYCETFDKLERTLSSSLKGYAEKAHFLDFAEARDGEGYVKRLNGLANCNADSALMASARHNISPDLFRISRAQLDPAITRWADQIGASKIYQRLVTASLES